MTIEWSTEWWGDRKFEREVKRHRSLSKQFLIILQWLGYKPSCYDQETVKDSGLNKIEFIFPSHKVLDRSGLEVEGSLCYFQYVFQGYLNIHYILPIGIRGNEKFQRQHRASYANGQNSELRYIHI